MPSVYNQKQDLLERIRRSFKDVDLGNGVSISQTEVCDMYGSEEEMREARKKDVVYDWPRVLFAPAFLEISNSGIGGHCFLDAPGLHWALLNGGHHDKDIRERLQRSLDQYWTFDHWEPGN